MENGFLTRNQGLDMIEKITGFVKSRTYDRNAIDNLLVDKQDVLNFDNTPTENSTNPVTSGGVYDAISNPDLYEVNIFYDFTLDELKIPTEYTQVGYAVYKNGEDITNTITNFKTFVDNLNNTNNILKFYSVKSSSVDTPNNHRELLRNYMSSTNFVTMFNIYNSDVVGTIRFKTDEITCTFKESTIDVVDRIVEDTYGCNVHIVLDVTDVPVTDIDLNNLMFANVEDYVQTIKYAKYKVNKTAYSYDTEVTYTDSIVKFINNVLPSLNAHYNLSITVDIIKSTGESSWEERNFYAEYINHGINEPYDNYLKLSHDFSTSGASDIYDYPQNSMQYAGLIVVPGVEYPEGTSHCKIARVVDTELTENSNNYITSGTMFDIIGNYYTKSETNNLLNDKQDALTFDTVPTDKSENPVTSDGIYNDIHMSIAEDSTYESVKTLSNCGAFPMPSLKVGIEPQQDLHGYDKPWAGGANYNQCPEEWVTFGSNSLRSSDNFDVQPETEYYYCSPVATQIYYRDADGNNLSDITNPEIVGANRTFTTPSGCYKILLALSNYGTTYNNNIAVNYPSSITTYSPYANECPITGWDAVNLNECGKNLFSYTGLQEGRWDNSGFVGSKADVILPSIYGIWFYKKIKVNEGDVITSSNLQTQGGVYSAIIGDDETDVISIFLSTSNNRTQTIPSGGKYICYCMYAAANTNPAELYPNAQVEVGTTSTTYEAYNGQTYTENLATTNYGGYWDVTEGEIVDTHANIDSYDGETLTGAWISSMDEYTEGGTPTTGAQVVYELATPTTATTTPRFIKANDGTTNLWADTGDVGDVRYIVKNAASDIITAVKDICYTKSEIDAMIGDISSTLDTINGEVV